MPLSKPRKRKQHGEVMPPLLVSETIDSLLKELLTIFPSKQELTEAEIEHWHRDLSPFPAQAIIWAFDAHRRNGRFFPVYGEILDLCVSWEPITGKSACNAECKRKHGKGYGENDMIWLWKRYGEKRAQMNGPLKEAEVEEILVALDKFRGHAPSWRVTA